MADEEVTFTEAGKVATGFSFPYVAKYAASAGAITYSGAMELARGVNVTPSPTTSDENKFYANNQEAESAGGKFTGGTVKLTPDAPPSSSSTVYRTTASTLNLRSGPGTGYAVIGKLKKGIGCTILKSSGNWRKIKTLKGTVGWVSRNYLTASATAKVTASALNVRKGPGTGSAILGSLKRNTKVTIKYTSGNWAYITSSKLTGYVSLNYLKF